MIVPICPYLGTLLGCVRRRHLAHRLQVSCNVPLKELCSSVFLELKLWHPLELQQVRALEPPKDIVLTFRVVLIKNKVIIDELVLLLASSCTLKCCRCESVATDEAVANDLVDFLKTNI
jgi:hypothetical protein